MLLSRALPCWLLFQVPECSPAHRTRRCWKGKLKFCQTWCCCEVVLVRSCVKLSLLEGECDIEVEFMSVGDCIYMLLGRTSRKPFSKIAVWSSHARASSPVPMLSCPEGHPEAVTCKRSYNADLRRGPLVVHGLQCLPIETDAPSSPTAEPTPHILSRTYHRMISPFSSHRTTPRQHCSLSIDVTIRRSESGLYIIWPSCSLRESLGDVRSLEIRSCLSDLTFPSSCQA